MRILFVYRGYGKDFTNSVIDSQKDSLLKQGITVLSFPIKTGGIKGYWKSIGNLKKCIQTNNIDIVHAHYSLSGIVSALATKKPVVCSLMGSDLLQQKGFLKKLILHYHKRKWKKTIVKSKQMSEMLHNSVCIPNGVDTKNFKEIIKQEACEKTGFDKSKKNIIFIAQNTDSHIKNFQLASNALHLLKDTNICIHKISEITFEELPFYYNAADVLLLTSISEGSPNVIKEAMSCNCPIVATDVGDIREVIGETEGCYITSFDPDNVALKLQLALAYVKRTNGRERIFKLGLDSESIAKRIIEVYREVIENV